MAIISVNIATDGIIEGNSQPTIALATRGLIHFGTPVQGEALKWLFVDLLVLNIEIGLEK